MAVHLGGVSLSDSTVKDERTEDEKIIQSLLAKADTASYSNDCKKAITIYNLVLEEDHKNIQAWYSKGITLGN